MEKGIREYISKLESKDKSIWVWKDQDFVIKKKKLNQISLKYNRIYVLCDFWYIKEFGIKAKKTLAIYFWIGSHSLYYQSAFSFLVSRFSKSDLNFSFSFNIKLEYQYNESIDFLSNFAINHTNDYCIKYCYYKKKEIQFIVLSTLRSPKNDYTISRLHMIPNFTHEIILEKTYVILPNKEDNINLDSSNCINNLVVDQDSIASINSNLHTKAFSENEVKEGTLEENNTLHKKCEIAIFLSKTESSLHESIIYSMFDSANFNLILNKVDEQKLKDYTFSNDYSYLEYPWQMEEEECYYLRDFEDSFYIFSKGNVTGISHIFESEEQKEIEENQNDEENKERSEERRVGKECRSRWSPYH